MSNIHKRGFASLSAERKYEIASQGGRAAHAKGVAHKWDLAAAREAGRKGGLRRQALRRAQQATA